MFGLGRVRGGEEAEVESGVRPKSVEPARCDECGGDRWVRVVRERRTPFRRAVTLVAVQCADCGRTPF